MAFLSRVLWLVPLAVHVGYAARVFSLFPLLVGRTVDDAGIPVLRFFVMWFCTVLFADAAFVLIHLKLPKFKDAMFGVPRKQYWLETSERRQELIEKLRGILDVALFGLNVFFLAVFQAIYQANVLMPIISINGALLTTGFMAVPLILVSGYFIVVVAGLGRNTRA